ncbi:hypothetical protein ACX9R5_00865 [Rathayibacter sp. CAU 1779]
MPIAAEIAQPPVRSSSRERVALAILLTAGFTLAVDFSILTVALPRIGRDVGIPTGDLQWITTSYALCAAGFTLLFGRVSDLVGCVGKQTNSSGLQVADLVARPIGVHDMRPSQPNHAWNLLEQKLVRSKEGALHGYGLKVYP